MKTKTLNQMIAKSLFAFCILYISSVSVAFSQEEDLSEIPSDSYNVAIISPIYSSNPETNNLSFLDSLELNPRIISESDFKCELVPDPQKLENIKAGKNAIKNKILQQSLIPQEEQSENLMPQIVIPKIGSNFIGNLSNGPTPLDNSIAISNDGLIISLINSNINMYNTSGILKSSKSLYEFFTTSFASDPQILFDKRNNRFIITLMGPPDPDRSKLLIAFSRSSSPTTNTEDWYIFKLSGNPLNNNCFIDFPRMAVTNDELFVTGNLFQIIGDDTSFYQSVIYQINKNQGYSGLPMNWNTWSDINSSPFAILPLGHGQGGSYQNCWFAATSESGGDWVKLYSISGTLGNNPHMGYKLVNTDDYSVPGDASQPTSNKLLDIGDCRVLSGFKISSTIHLTINFDKGSGFCGIGYFRINTSDYTSKLLKWYGSSNNDYAYGSIASFANVNTDNTVIIGMLRSSLTINPEIRVVSCDGSGNWSGSVTVHHGESYVVADNKAYERWGDYSGIARKHNSTNPAVWMSGMYGTSDHLWGTWISEIYQTAASGVSDGSEQKTSIVYPIPAEELIKVKFDLDNKCFIEINLLDLTGKIITSVYSGQVFPGTNELSFNTAKLKNGNYFLKIISLDGNLNKTIKIIVSHK